MRSRAAVAVATSAVVLAGGLVHAATADPARLAAPTGLTVGTDARTVHLAWDAVAFPSGTTDDAVLVTRDGAPAATLAAKATSWVDPGVAPAETHSYALVAHAVRGTHDISSAQSSPVRVTLPAYFVGAATRDITPAGRVNLGGFGLGDGTFFPEPTDVPLPDPVGNQSVGVGRGGIAGPSDQRIRARAVVFDDGKNAVAIADIETQGMFAAYEAGPYGLHDMAEQVAADIPGLPVDHIVIASDHTHHGPDTIGVWGGVSDEYLRIVKAQTVAAIEEAYSTRTFADVRAGQSDASSLVYNQACSEALNQDRTATYTGPDVCAVPGKDGMMRVVQATTPAGQTVVTLVVYAAHSTTNMGSAIDGDWPQIIGDQLAETYGGVGMGMEGANGGTQPCRPTCSFTDKNEPGYNISNRYAAIVANYTGHVRDALVHAKPVTGPVRAAQGYIREAVMGPFVNALFVAGSHAGTPLMRSHESPWMVAQTVRTVVADVRVGSLLFDATPGEGFPAIRQGVQDAVDGPGMVIQLGLANDQLGYLIAPLSYVPVIAAEAAVNDNILFNVSPTIGDHVMCADIALAHLVAGSDWTVTDPAGCAGYDGVDTVQAAAGDPVSQVPVGGLTSP